MPRSHRDGEPVECTEGYALPVLDLLAASASGALAAVALLEDCDEEGDPIGLCEDIAGNVTAVGVSAALAFTISALRGLDRVGRCRHAKRVYLNRISQAQSEPEREPHPQPEREPHPQPEPQP